MAALPPIDFPAFVPHSVARGARTQTVLGSFSKRKLGDFEERAESRILRTDETTRIRVEIDRPEPRERASGSGLVVLHGLGGSASSRYVLGTAQKARDAGFTVVRVNARNCGDTAELTSRPYNGEDTADIARAAHELVEAEGVERVHLVGFSVGGNQTLRLAAEWSADPPPWLTSVCVVSPCIDFAAASDGLRQGLFRRSVQTYFLDGLKDIVRARAALDPTIDLAPLEGVDSIRAFDDAYTAPLSGYPDADAYYRGASMRGRLHELRVPTLLVASRDDPLVPFACFEENLDGAPVRLLATDEGGHVGFLGSGPASNASWQDVDRRWAENRVVQFARSIESA